MRAIETTLLLFACAAPMAAQDAGKPATGQEKKPMTDPSMQHKQRMVVKGEAVLGADIRSGGEDIGDVKDLIVDREGRIQYAVLGIDEGDDRRVAVPWNAVQVNTKQEDPDEWEVSVLVDAQRLKTAPSFTDNDWPSLATAEWARETDEFFREIGDMGRDARPAGTPADEAGARPAGMARAMSFRATKLQGCQVDTSEGKNAGEIENLAIDAKNGRIPFVVLSTGGFLGLGEDHHAVPMQAFTFSREAEGDDLQCKLNIPESKLEGAPKFDKSDWDAAGDVVFVEKLYTHYGFPGYWNGKGAMGVGEDPLKKPGDHGGGR